MHIAVITLMDCIFTHLWLNLWKLWPHHSCKTYNYCMQTRVIKLCHHPLLTWYQSTVPWSSDCLALDLPCDAIYRILRKGSTLERLCTFKVSRVCMSARQSHTVCWPSPTQFSSGWQLERIIWEIMIRFWTIMWLPIHWGCWWKWCFALYNEGCHEGTYISVCSIAFHCPKGGLLLYNC